MPTGMEHRSEDILDHLPKSYKTFYKICLDFGINILEADNIHSSNEKKYDEKTLKNGGKKNE